MPKCHSVSPDFTLVTHCYLTLKTESQKTSNKKEDPLTICIKDSLLGSQAGSNRITPRYLSPLTCLIGRTESGLSRLSFQGRALQLTSLEEPGSSHCTLKLTQLISS